MDFNKLKNVDEIVFFMGKIPHPAIMMRVAGIKKLLTVPVTEIIDNNINNSIFINSKRILLVDCIGAKLSIGYLKTFETDIVKYCDLIEMLHDLKLAYCYVPIIEEKQFAIDNIDNYKKLSTKFTDKKSIEVLRARFNFLMDFDRIPVLNVMDKHSYEYFHSSGGSNSLPLKGNEIYLDIGAWQGDTVAKFLKHTSTYKEIHAFEPDKKNFDILKNATAGLNNCYAYNIALGDNNSNISFLENKKDTMSSRVLPNVTTNSIKCTTLDDIQLQPTLIKMDVEGYENKILKGAINTIKTYKPNLAIACYHYPNDIIDITNTVLEAHEYKYVALRHYDSSSNEYVLFFSDEFKFE
jgi:FkbM family methyltransferase